MKKKFLIITFLIIILQLVLAISDYERVKNEEFPIFALNFKNEEKKSESFIGPFYFLKRTIKNNFEENLHESLEIKYKLFFKEIKITHKKKQDEEFIKFEFQKNDIHAPLFQDKNSYYSYNIENLNVLYKDKSFSFKDFIKRYGIDFVLDKSLKADRFDTYNYTIYDFNNLKIIKCHSHVDKGQLTSDIHLFEKNYKFNKLICNNNCTVIRSFKILKKVDKENSLVNINYNDKNYTIKIEKNIFDKIEENKFYYFLLSNNKANKNVNLKSIEDVLEKMNIEDFKETFDNDKLVNTNFCL